MGGGFQLAEREEYLKLCQFCYDGLEQDKKNGIKPIWDDESILQRYISVNKPEKILDPGYHYPEGNLPYYKKIWGRDYEKKIVLLDKNHSEVR
jgi:hypothetical protein